MAQKLTATDSILKDNISKIVRSRVSAFYLFCSLNNIITDIITQIATPSTSKHEAMHFVYSLPKTTSDVLMQRGLEDYLVSGLEVFM